MFSDFFQIGKRRVNFSDHRADSTQCSSFERLASVERVRVLDKLQIVFAHVIDHVFSSFDMTKGEFVMVLVIEYVEEITVEGMNVFDFGKVFEDVEEFLVKSFLAEFDFSHVEGSDAADGIARVDDCGCFSLGF